MDSLEISAAGLRVQRARMDVIAANLANVDVTSARTETRDGHRPSTVRAEAQRGMSTQY